MEWYRDLYIGNSIKDKVKKIKKKLDQNRGQINVYCISISASQNDLFDIIPAWEITVFRKHYDELKIVGLTGDYDEAVALIGTIVLDIKQKTDRLDIREYLLDNWKA